MLLHTSWTRRALLQSMATAFVTAGEIPRLSFSVFGLLKPQCVKVASVRGSRLHVESAGERWILEPGSPLTLTSSSARVRISGADERPTLFLLEIPGIIRRVYQGTLTVSWNSRALTPIVTMEREIAVASIVGAELPLEASTQEALRAQAIVARSFVTGTQTPRHANAFFCDTTHCQFLRSPFSKDDRSLKAALDTESLVLHSQGEIVAAQYSAACGGTTRAGERDGFRYQSVACAVCRDNHFSRRGHGWGLCQEGALAMGRSGSSCASILSEYFPGASLSAMRPV
jgi:peptidoglycan hydrolase-like amidase